MTRKADKYAEFVEHPRYGRRPNITGLDPKPWDRDVHLHWGTMEFHEIIAQHERVTGKKWPYGNPGPNSDRAHRIRNTAIVADLDRQTPATVPVTHYFDLERRCRDCGRPFIFFAEEQKHWYEELGFGLDSDCIRCVECRKRQQGIASLRETYETLLHIPARTAEQTFEMADACMCLIESNAFTVKQTQRVRMLLNVLAEDSHFRESSRGARLLQRVVAAEKKQLGGNVP